MTETTVTTVPVAPSGIEAKESSRLVGLVTGVVNAVFLGLTSYGITYDSKLPSLIIALIIALVTFLGFIIPVVQAEVTRGKVYSAASVWHILQSAAKAAPPVIAAGEAVAKDIAPSVPDGAPAQPATAQAQPALAFDPHGA